MSRLVRRLPPMFRAVPHFLFWLAPALLAAEAAAADMQPVASPGGAIRELGTVRVDLVTRSLLVTGHVNQVGGIVEYLAVGAEGKTHESILVVDATPSDVHGARLLLGLKPGGGVREQGKGMPKGPLVEVWIEWEGEGEARRLPAERAYLDLASTNRLPASGWVFTGSSFHEGRYMADVDLSLIANYWDPWAVLNLPQKIGAFDDRLVACEDDLPLLDHPVVLRLTPRPAAAPAAAPGEAP